MIRNITFIIAVLIPFLSSSQPNSKKPFSLDLYTSNKVSGTIPFYVQGNYQFFNKLAAGIFLGYSGGRYYTNMFGTADTTFADYYNSSIIFYGINSRYYILKGNRVLSPYISGKLGGIWNKMEFENFPAYNNTASIFDYGIYAGTKLIIYKPVSFFAELGYAKFDTFRFGLSYRFL